MVGGLGMEFGEEIASSSIGSIKHFYKIWKSRTFLRQRKFILNNIDLAINNVESSRGKWMDGESFAWNAIGLLFVTFNIVYFLTCEFADSKTYLVGDKIETAARMYMAANEFITILSIIISGHTFTYFFEKNNKIIARGAYFYVYISNIFPILILLFALQAISMAGQTRDLDSLILISNIINFTFALPFTFFLIWHSSKSVSPNLNVTPGKIFWRLIVAGLAGNLASAILNIPIFLIYFNYLKGI